MIRLTGIALLWLPVKAHPEDATSASDASAPYPTITNLAIVSR
jgi:hypothetical protein